MFFSSRACGRLSSVNCPYCSYCSGLTGVPSRPSNAKICDCPNCDRPVFSIETQTDDEASRAETVRAGERREEWAADTIVSETGIADRHEDRGRYSDIDRSLFREGSESPRAFMEFKERTCTLNAFAETAFPYAKIETGQELVGEQGVPVVIVLKFLDAWTVHKIDSEREYEKGDFYFTPDYRGEWSETEHQKPALLPVDELARIDIGTDCRSPSDLREMID